MTVKCSDGRQALIGIVDDERLSHGFSEIPTCCPTVSPNLDHICDVKLLDASGQETERRTEPLPDESR
ncbi:hypothetical protein [Streptomyces sp. TLI_105]|uniref:hypothetical protein n=1 Tax=Streptomyces sp. TLI_105 TaxID=1881019 RepID=UPI000B823DBB|nr:hypothetical protein [Streptomyces sp. TLI_105]